jgi:hypothetical protein
VVSQAGWPWRCHRGKTPRGPYHGAKGGDSGRMGWRRLRRSRRQTQLRNGGAVAELDAGGWSDGVHSRSASCCCCGWARERGGKQETECMEGETGRGPGGLKAGRRCHVASSPAHGRHAACVAWRGWDVARGRRRVCVREREHAWSWASEAMLGQKGGTWVRERGGAERA